MTIPYTYLLTFIPTGQLYYGVRYREECHPDELFKTYFSSSRVVKKLISEYGVESFNYQIRRVFNSKQAARDWEQRLLIRIDAENNHNFLNQSNNLKGILRSPGSYAWCYNPETNEKLLHPTNIMVPSGFILGKRGPDSKQQGRMVISNPITLRETKINKLDPIPDGWVIGRSRDDPTFGTRWICNDLTMESKLILESELVPDGWRYGKISFSMRGRVRLSKNGITKTVPSTEVAEYMSNGWSIGGTIVNKFKVWKNIDSEIVIKSINHSELEYYLSDGWTRGSYYGHTDIFKIDGHMVVYDHLKSNDPSLVCKLNDGWHRGHPKFYKITYTDGTVQVHDHRYFKQCIGISRDMLDYCIRNKVGSKKYRVDNVSISSIDEYEQLMSQ